MKKKFRLPLAPVCQTMFLAFILACGSPELRPVPPQQQTTGEARDKLPDKDEKVEKSSAPEVLPALPHPLKMVSKPEIPLETFSPRIAPGDTVSIDIPGEKELGGSFPVYATGSILHPLLKNVEIGGKTLEEARVELTRRFSRYLVDPIVHVSVKFLEKKVYVSGSSRGFETLPLPTDRSMMASQLLMSAGIPSDADISQIYIVRQKQGARQNIPLPFDKIVQQNQWDKDVSLESEDYIVIPKSDKIYVQGNVGSPGAFAIRKDQKMTLWDVLLLAHGPTGNADLEHIKVWRQKEGKLEAQVVGISENRHSFVLQPNDLVFVPAMAESNQVTIYGEVKRPGSIQVQKGTRLSTVLALAGGLTEYASNRIQLTRYLPDGKTERFSVHFKSLLAGDKEQDLLVRPGDVIYIDSSLF